MYARDAWNVATLCGPRGLGGGIAHGWSGVPRARSATCRRLGGEGQLRSMIADEAELTAGVRIEPGRKYGFFTDTTLCIGCKACEVACKEWNLLPADDIGLTGKSYDNTGELSATSWRHVSFVEQVHGGYYHAAVPEQLAHVERRVQTLRERRLPGSMSNRSAVSDGVRQRCRTAGHLQWLRLLRASLSVRRGRARRG